jgi:hypothetical protein
MVEGRPADPSQRMSNVRTAGRQYLRSKGRNKFAQPAGPQQPHTTAAVYTKPILESVQVAVNSYEDRASRTKPELELVK